MYIIGDIGNTEVKICLIDNNFIIKKKINIKTSDINKTKIKNNLNFYLKNKKNIKNISKNVN
jgi:predicted NBD/HSP70 family sugar kinase